MARFFTDAEMLDISRVCALSHAYECLYNLSEGEDEFDCFVYIAPHGWKLPFVVCPHAGDALHIEPCENEMGYHTTRAELN